MTSLTSTNISTADGLCFLLTEPNRFFSMLERSICPLPVCPLLDFTVVCVFVLCEYTLYECMDKMTSVKVCAEICVCVCFWGVRVSQSKQWSQAKWRMEKLHLRKWPLGAVLSVLEGLQGHYKHTHTHTLKFRNERVCPGGTMGSLPY